MGTVLQNREHLHNRRVAVGDNLRNYKGNLHEKTRKCECYVDPNCSNNNGYRKRMSDVMYDDIDVNYNIRCGENGVSYSNNSYQRSNVRCCDDGRNGTPSSRLSNYNSYSGWKREPKPYKDVKSTGYYENVNQSTMHPKSRTGHLLDVLDNSNSHSIKWSAAQVRDYSRYRRVSPNRLGSDRFCDLNHTTSGHDLSNNNGNYITSNVNNSNAHYRCRLDDNHHLRGHQLLPDRKNNTTLSSTTLEEESAERNENCAFWIAQCEKSSYFLSNRPPRLPNDPFDKYCSNLDSTSSICTSSSISPSSSLSSLSTPSSFSSFLHRPKNYKPENEYSTTYQQYYQRRRMRTRKFRLNLFMYANLYRKQRRAESSYEIYHNPMEDPDSIYTSFSNPNYFLNRPTSLSTSTNNNNNSDETASLEKLSLASDASGHYSDYSSCEPTPTTPDRSLILHKLNSADEYDDYDDVDDDNKNEEIRSLIESRSSDDSGEDGMREGGGKGGDPHVYYGIGGLPWSKSKGILGYLEMLEKQAKARDAADENGRLKPDQDEEDDDKDSDDYGDDKKITNQTNGDGEDPNEQQRTEKFEHLTEINSPDSNDSGIQPGDKILSPDCPSDIETRRASEQDNKDQIKTEPDKLPDGWQKHEDEDGPYFWHVKSGTIQREPPPPAPPDGPSLCSPRSISLASDTTSTSSNSMPSTPTSVGSITERHLAEFEGQALLNYAAKSLQAMSHPDKRSADASGEKGVRFAVRSLGWVRIAEEDLNPERSSKAVNKCIVDLSLGRDDLNDSVARWGDGKELFMDLDQHSLRLVNPSDGVVLNSQPIHSIRVWGVGRDNGRERDFAYVARDRKTRIHMCHVFHCDVPARQIANTLRDICKKIMLERNLHQSAVARLARPTDLPNLDKVGQHTNGEKLSFQNLYNNARFPTPMEEPRKVIRCHYLGVIEVPRPTGRDVMNEAIQNLYYRIPPEKWIFVSVAIAPSTLTIIESGNCETILAECRVRFLSFMGIAADNVKLGAYIMHTAQNKFMCHVFHCEPSAGPLCKTIEAACKLRYQKCMDAHPQQAKAGLQAKSLRSSIKQSIQCVWGSVTNLTSPK